MSLNDSLFELESALLFCDYLFNLGSGKTCLSMTPCLSWSAPYCLSFNLYLRIWKDMSLNDSLSELERSKLAVWDYPVSDKYTKV